MLKFFQSTSKYPNIIATVALVIWVIKIVWLDRIAPLFPRAHELGLVVEITLGQIVASYVFYIFFVHKVDYDDRILLLPFVRKGMIKIYADAKRQLLEVQTASRKSLSFDSVHPEALRSAFESMPDGFRPRLQLDDFTWIEYFTYHQQRTKETIERLLRLGRLLEPDTIAKLMTVDECQFFDFIDDAKNRSLTGLAISSISGSFYQYIVACRGIKAWVDADGEFAKMFDVQKHSD